MIKEVKVHGTIGAVLPVDKNLWCGACANRDEIQIRSSKVKNPNIDSKHLPFLLIISQTCKARKVIPMDLGPAACFLVVENRIWVGSFKAVVVFNRQVRTCPPPTPQPPQHNHLTLSLAYSPHAM